MTPGTGRLHLKRTPAEQAEHEWRKTKRASKRASKRARRSRRSDSDEEEEPTAATDAKRRRTSKTSSQSNTYDFVFDDSDVDIGPPPPGESSSGAQHPDFESIRAELEEQRFREKMWGAFEDDERLDAMEARLNDYAHVPGRWRSGRGGDPSALGDDDPAMDPQMMDDEEYAEWIRAGMWRYFFAPHVYHASWRN